MLVQFMWVTGNGERFERSVPLLWHGEHLQRNGWSNTIILCFLQGIELLSSEYLSTLRSLGYEVVDGTRYVNAVTKHYPNIYELSTTSRYWFLRWNVLYAMTLERSATSVIHLDGDVVLLADPEKLATDVFGKTFMLQGCPAFTVISDFSWFDTWRVELAQMLKDRPAYIAKAAAEKTDPHCADKDFCNICAYGPYRFEDQDMLEYLIAAGRLPQARTSDVFESEFYWIQNPLLPGEWHEEQVSHAPRQVREQASHTFVGSKQLAFYHFQTDFAKYCLVWSHLAYLGMQSHAAKIKPTGAYRKNSILLDFAGKVYEWMNEPVNRRAAYQKAFSVNRITGNRYITDIVNSCWD